MKPLWQRGMLVGALTFIGLVLMARFAQAQPLSRITTARTAPQFITSPLTDTAVYTWYFPVILRPPGMLYGSVTENGAPAANVDITLVQCLEWFFNPGGQFVCTNSASYDAVTDQRGWYAFIDPPTLVSTTIGYPNQTYQAQWINTSGVPTRLSYWTSRVIGTYTQGDFVNLGNFDIGGITLLTPTANSTAHFPVTFQWIPRHNVFTDAYNVCVEGGLVIPKFDPGDFICLGPNTYTNQVTLSDPFSGIDYGYGYDWFVQMPDDTGGVGYSAHVPFTFAPP